MKKRQWISASAVLLVVSIVLVVFGDVVVGDQEAARTGIVRHRRRKLQGETAGQEGGNVTRQAPFLTGPPPQQYKVEAVGDGAVVARDGRNTNFPSVIRVPDWVPRKSRAHPKAKYYLYYSSHTANFISMSWASKLKGPWTPYNLTAGPFQINGELRTSRGVMDFGADPERHDWDHAASPDVHVVDRTFVMYFHGINGPDLRKNPDAIPLDNAKIAHRGFAATSATGLNFNSPLAGGEEGHGPITVTYDGVTTEVCFNDRYSRVFHRRRQIRRKKGKIRTLVEGPFAMGIGGAVSRPADFDRPLAFNNKFNVTLEQPNIQKKRIVQPGDCTWLRYETPTAIFKSIPRSRFSLEDRSAIATFLASEEFALHPNNHLPGRRIGIRDRLTHVGVFPLDDGRIEVFFWIKSENQRYPDIYRVILDVSDDDMARWDVSREPGTNQVYFDVILTPQQASKLVTKALRRERKKSGDSQFGLDEPLDFATQIFELGDPFVFWDEKNEKKYLFVSYSVPQTLIPVKNFPGEGQITAFRLVPLGQ